MIKIINNIIKVDPSGLPFSPNKLDNPFPLVAAALNLGGNVASGLIGASAQDRANQTNIALAREARQWQAEESQKARDFSLMMSDRQNHWLSPANQRQLLRDGGYNPYIYGQSYQGQGASIPSSPLASAPDTPHVSPVNPLMGLGQGISESISDFAQLFNLKNQSLQVEANVDLQKMKSLDTIADIGAKVFDKLGRKGYNQFMELYAPALDKLNWQGSPAERLLSARILTEESNAQLAALRQQIEERYGYQRAERQLQILQMQPDFIAAQISKLSTGAKLDEAYAYRVGSEVARNMAQAGFFNAQANQLTSLLPYLVTQFQLQLGNLGIDFSRNLADFNFEEFWRDYQSTDFGKVNKAAANASDSKNNPIVGFVKGVLDFSPLGKGSKAVKAAKDIKVPFKPQSGFDSDYVPSWQSNGTLFGY